MVLSHSRQRGHFPKWLPGLKELLEAGTVKVVVGYAAGALLLPLLVAMEVQSFVVLCAVLGAAVLAAGLL